MTRHDVTVRCESKQATIVYFLHPVLIVPGRWARVALIIFCQPQTAISVTRPTIRARQKPSALTRQPIHFAAHTQSVMSGLVIKMKNYNCLTVARERHAHVSCYTYSRYIYICIYSLAVHLQAYSLIQNSNYGS